MLFKRNLYFIRISLLLLALNTININAQAAKVYSEGGQNSISDKQRENGISFLTPITSNLENAKKAINKASKLIANATSEKDIINALNLANQAKSFAETGKAAYFKIQKRTEKNFSLNTIYLKELNKNIGVANYYLENKSRWIADMKIKKREEEFLKKGGTVKVDNEIKAIENNIQLEKKKSLKLNKSASLLENELRNLNKVRNKKQITDFLAQKSSPKKSQSFDFLAKTSKNSSKQNNDFLAKKSTKNEDFLSEVTKADKNFIIDQKGGKQGVKTKSGKVLIPYRNWKIKKYIGGIALVDIIIESKKFDCGEGIIVKRGYVDNSGKFLDGYDIIGEKVTYYEPYAYRMLLTSTKNSLAQDIAARRRHAKNEKLRKQKKANKDKTCNLQITKWQINRLKFYRN